MELNYSSLIKTFFFKKKALSVLGAQVGACVPVSAPLSCTDDVFVAWALAVEWDTLLRLSCLGFYMIVSANPLCH